MISIIGAEQQQKPNSSAGFTLTKICIVFALIKEMRSMRETQLFAANSSSPIGSVIFWHFSFLCRQPAWVALISVRTCFELRAFYTPHLNWYMSAFLLHSSAASARLRVLSVYGGAIVTAFSIVTMTLYRWSSQSLCIIAIVVMITHAHSLPNVLPR